MNCTLIGLLLAPEAIDVLKRALIPHADLLTPNLPEAAGLLGEPVARSESAIRSQAERLLGLGAHAVLIKGGHAEGTESVDLLVEARTVTRLVEPRIAASNTHGTGCTLSSAVAAFLAKGMNVADAARAAKAYVTAAKKLEKVLDEKKTDRRQLEDVQGPRRRP